MRTASPPGMPGKPDRPERHYSSPTVDEVLLSVADKLSEMAEASLAQRDERAVREHVAFGERVAGLIEYGSDDVKRRLLLGEATPDDIVTIREYGARFRRGVLRSAPQPSRGAARSVVRVSTRRESRVSHRRTRKSASRSAGSSDDSSGEPPRRARGLSQYRYPVIARTAVAR